MAKKLGRGDKLDRYRDHLLQDKTLNDDQLEMLAKYRRANALMCMGYSRMQSMTILTKENEVSVPQAYAIVRDSIQLFGDVNKVDKDGMRYIMYENFMMAASLARKKEDYNAMIRALEDAARIYDLYSVDDMQIDPTMFMRPSEIIFSTDAQVLIDQQKNEIEDIDYEEAEGSE